MDVHEGDVTALDALRLWPRGAADCVYTDPPWNRGIAQLFRKWAGKAAVVDLDAFFDAFVRSLDHVCPEGPWYIDMGPDPSPLHGALRGHGVPIYEVADRVYDEKPYTVTLANAQGPAVPEGVEGEDVTRGILSALYVAGYRRVFDPCIGYGLTVRCAPFGMEVLGMDISAKRVHKTRELR